MTSARRAQCRAAQARYRQTAKGRETQRRYNATDKGRARRLRSQPNRLFLGQRYLGMAATGEDAARINAYIKERRCEFIAGQSARAEAESLTSRTISPETKL